MISLAIDLHQNILSAQCCLKCKISESVSKIQIKVDSDCLFMFLWHGSFVQPQVKILAPFNIFIPTTFSCIKYNSLTKSVFINNEFDAVIIDYEIQKLAEVTDTNKNLVFETSFRLQVVDDDAIKSSLRESIRLKQDFLTTEIKNNVPYHVICTNCNTVLTSRPLTFESIQDFHEEISELSETWFCHKHSENSIQNSTDNSDAKLYTLYVNELFFYFHNSVLEIMSLKKHKKEYRCSKCSSLLSAAIDLCSPKCVGFFCDEIKLKSTKSDSDSHLQYRKTTALLCFSQLIETHMQSSVSSKLFLQSKVAEENICLLLWITSQKVAQVLFHGVLMTADVTEIKMNAKEVYKVLYCIKSPDSDIVKSWKHDFNVDFFVISNNTMNVITELLKESSEFIHSEEKSVKDFKFGYIPSYSLNV